MTLLKDIQFVCLDGEFTGLNPDIDRVLELAAVRFTFSQIICQWQTLINPQHPITKEAQKVHHISDEMLYDKPKIATILPDFFDFIAGHILVGHAISYDIEMLKKEAERCQLPFPIRTNQVIDTLRLARFYGDSPNNSLQSLAQHFNVETGKTHRALDDVMVNIGVFKHLVRQFKTFEEIVELLAKPIQMKYMPLGKYKGRVFSEIPLAYLKWAVMMDFDQDLLFSIKLELKKRRKGDGFSHAANPFTQL